MKRKRTNNQGSVISVILVIIVVIVILAIIAFVLCFGGGFGGFGFGSGSGNGEASQVANEPSQSQEETEETKNSEASVKVVVDKIYLDGELCKDCEELRQKISDLQAANADIVVVYEKEDAILSTAEEVEAVLDKLQKTINLSVQSK